jgi:hypothetical protein
MLFEKADHLTSFGIWRSKAAVSSNMPFSRRSSSEPYLGLVASGLFSSSALLRFRR